MMQVDVISAGVTKVPPLLDPSYHSAELVMEPEMAEEHATGDEVIEEANASSLLDTTGLSVTVPTCTQFDHASRGWTGATCGLRDRRYHHPEFLVENDCRSFCAGWALLPGSDLRPAYYWRENPDLGDGTGWCRCCKKGTITAYSSSSPWRLYYWCSSPFTS